MRPLTALALSLAGTALSACQCTPDDGWPHGEDHLWRTVLDPQGAHSFDSSGGARPLALLERGDARGVEALVVGYRATARTTLATAGPAWSACEDPDLSANLRLARPEQAPDHPGVAWLGSATQVELPTPPGNPSATVVLAQEALEGLMGPGPRAPATVRTVLKQRRPSAPPVLLAVGDSDCTGMVALLNGDGTPLTSDAFELPGPACAPLAAMPPADFDGDGIRELVVRAGNGEPGVGTLRAVYHLGLDDQVPSLERVWHQSLTVRCP
jgi:hypothetical protein